MKKTFGIRCHDTLLDNAPVIESGSGCKNQKDLQDALARNHLVRSFEGRVPRPIIEIVELHPRKGEERKHVREQRVHRDELEPAFRHQLSAYFCFLHKH